MKKIFIFLPILFVSFNVEASGWETKPVDSLIMDKRISESVDCHEKKCINVFEIPNDYEEDEINIVPSVFTLSYKKIMPGDTYEDVIIIKNKSNDDYAYVDNTFYIKPFQSSDNESEIKSYIGENINKGGVMYRLNSSSALKSLYGVDRDLTDIEISDSELDKQLIFKGYNGIKDLDKYVLNYFGITNNNYVSVADEIATSLWPNMSEMPHIRETNKQLIKFGYDYFYNRLFSMHLDNQDNDNIKYTIGNWERDSNIYDEINNKLSNIYLRNNNELTINPLYFHINGNLTNNSYALFEFGLDFGFKIKKIDNGKEVDAVVKPINDNKDELIVDTGVDSDIMIIIMVNIILLFFLIMVKELVKIYDKEN